MIYVDQKSILYKENYFNKKLLDKNPKYKNKIRIIYSNNYSLITAVIYF